jgi:glutaconate CoA-transferase subunit A
MSTATRSPGRTRDPNDSAGTSEASGEIVADKTTTLDECAASVQSGMTIGIGGWGSRRKPMALVRALLRTDVTDLTVVTYGGPDLGLLCSANKVKRVYYGFVSLDSPPFYDPWFAKARTTGSIEAREMDEGMLRCGLQAAAQRLPFLPIRAGLGSDVRAFWGDELKTVRSPYPTPAIPESLRSCPPEEGCEELVAMPALNLDVALVHLNLGDAQGNAAYTGIDPYFDDLFLMSAQKRLLSVERVVSTEELVKAVPPQALLVNRMMVDSVVEAPNGAHFTTAEPDYRRDEKFQRHYAEAAGSEETWTQFVSTYLSGSEADYQAAVRKFTEEQGAAK